MRKKLIGVFLILLAALILLQGYFVKWDISKMCIRDRDKTLDSQVRSMIEDLTW